MKRYVLLGTVGAGKSTLYAALHGIACDEAKKTQAMQYDLDGGVDTNDPLCRLPAGFLNIYTQREVICAITKVDLPDADFEATKAMLMDHGVSGPFFPLGKDRPELLQELVDWLKKE